MNLPMGSTANTIFEYISPEINFIKEIELHVQTANGEYIDSIVHYCNKRNIEIEQIVPLIKNSPMFKTAIQKEAERLNFLKRKKRRKE